MKVYLVVITDPIEGYFEDVQVFTSPSLAEDYVKAKEYEYVAEMIEREVNEALGNSTEVTNA